MHWGEETETTTKEHRARYRAMTRVVADIMFSDRYMDAMEELERDKAALSTLAADPRGYLERKGVQIPNEIEVIHHPESEVPRVDLHWKVENPERAGNKAGCYYCQPCCCYSWL